MTGERHAPDPAAKSRRAVPAVSERCGQSARCKALDQQQQHQVAGHRPPAHYRPAQLIRRSIEAGVDRQPDRRENQARRMSARPGPAQLQKTTGNPRGWGFSARADANPGPRSRISQAAWRLSEEIGMGLIQSSL